MAGSRKDSSPAKPNLPPARTLEARENQLISLAMDLVETRILNGTASAQETTHFLKLGTVAHQKEMEKLQEEITALRTKTEQMATSERDGQIAAEALAAMRSYQGLPTQDDVFD